MAGSRLGPGRDAELRQDRGHVMAGSLGRDVQPGRDLRVGQALGDQGEDLVLAPGKAELVRADGERGPPGIDLTPRRSIVSRVSFAAAVASSSVKRSRACRSADSPPESNSTRAASYRHPRSSWVLAAPRQSPSSSSPRTLRRPLPASRPAVQETSQCGAARLRSRRAATGTRCPPWASSAPPDTGDYPQGRQSRYDSARTTYRAGD